MQVLIAGCGYTGFRIAQCLLKRGITVTALVRSEASVTGLFGSGVRTVRADLDAPVSSDIFSVSYDLLYYLAPPPSTGDTDPRVRNLLNAFSSSSSLQRIVYFSTSGVYGNSDGGWVTESDPLCPTTDRSRRRLDAERVIENYSARHGCEYAILRVPGIYGPERIPLERVKRGLPVVRAEEAAWSNRIHVEDLVHAAIAAGEKGAATGAFNISDGTPGTMTEYFQTIAAVFGLPLLPEVTLDVASGHLSPEMMSYLQESRRLDISRISRELGYSPRYSDLREALCRIRDGLDQ